MICFHTCWSFLDQTEGGDGWQRDQLCGQVESQLRTEMEESQKQLKCAHDTQQEQKNQIQSLRYINYYSLWKKKTKNLSMG